MNKKLLTLVLAGLALGLTACGGETTSEEQPSNDPATTEADPTTVDDTTEDETTSAEQITDDTVLSWDAYDALAVAGNVKVLVDEAEQDAKWEYTEAGQMMATSLNGVKALQGVEGGEGEAVYNALKERNLKALYVLEGVVVGTHDAGWTTKVIDGAGEVVSLNGSKALKVIGCNYDAEDDNWITDAWLIDKGMYAEALNSQIDLSFPHAEEKDAADRDWTANPVVVNGAGVYTVVYAEYNGLQGETADCHAGLAVIKTEARDDVDDQVYPVESVELIGSFNGWADDGVVALDGDGSGVFEGSIELEADAQFKVRVNSAWSYAYGFADLTVDTTDVTASSDGNLVASTAGTFMVRIGFNNPANLAKDASLSVFAVILLK